MIILHPVLGLYPISENVLLFKSVSLMNTKLLALGEEDKSLKSRENQIDLLYCNIVTNTSVGAITKVNCVSVFHLNNSKKLY